MNQQHLAGLMQESNRYNISAFKLAFDLDDGLKNDLAAAADHYKKLVGEVKMSVVSYGNMDRSFIKSKHISPDFVFQMAFQLANYKLFTKTGKHVARIPGVQRDLGSKLKALSPFVQRPPMRPVRPPSSGEVERKTFARQPWRRSWPPMLSPGAR